MNVSSKMASSRLNLTLPVRLGLWVFSSTVLSVIFFREFWVGLPAMLSPGRIFGQNEASPWGVLTLCFIFLWLKRKQIRDGMQPYPSPVFIPVGLGVTAMALAIPLSADYVIFRLLLVWLGVFVVFFGKGARMPLILLVIYGFTISYPLVIRRFADDFYAQTVIVPLKWLLNTLGYPFTTEGQWLHLMSSKGDLISVVVTVACAGPSTMAVFIAIFTLMMLDMPLPPKKAAWLFLFGVVGTWTQNLIRVTILIVTGYYLGEKALWAAHSWTIYLLFPLWYLLFVFIYFRQFERQKPVDRQPVSPIRGGVV